MLLPERCHPKIGDLGSSRLCYLRLTLTSGIGTPLYMAPEMCDSADSTAAADVYSVLLIVSEGFVGRPAFSATTTLPVLLRNVVEGAAAQVASMRLNFGRPSHRIVILDKRHVLRFRDGARCRHLSNLHPLNLIEWNNQGTQKNSLFSAISVFWRS
jgi:serine/threonine protein kinase